MKQLGVGIAIALLFALVSCRQPTSPANQFQPVRLEVEGAYTHSPTSIELPLTAGPFGRIGITKYDEGETDVSGHYEHFVPPKRISATVYIYPAPRVVSIGSPANVIESAKSNVVASHFRALKREILANHPQAKLVSEERVSLPSLRRMLKGEKTEFQFTSETGNTQFPASSFLYLFRCDDWLLKIRATAPRKLRADMENAVDKLISELPIP